VLVPGHETDAFTREPKPTRLDINLISSAGVRTAASMPWPSGTFDVGDLSPDEFAAFEAVGRNAQGEALLRGRTLPVVMGRLEGAQLPVFVGRVGEMARPPGYLPATRSGGVAGVLYGQVAVFTGGFDAVDGSGAQLSPSTAAGYDLGVWAPLSTLAVLPRAAQSMAIVGQQYALLLDAGGATWLDFDTAAEADAVAPSGLSFDQVAGAAPVMDDDGGAWLVGATRQGAAGSAVLRVNRQLTLQAYTLSAPRNGAAVAWVTGRGLVVVGGSDTAPGVEVLAPGSSEFVALPFAPEPLEGAAATALDGNRLLLAGGSDPQGTPMPARTLDLACSSSCTPQSLAGTENAALSSASAWTLSPSRALVFGTAPGGAPDAGNNCVVVVKVLGTTGQAEAIPLREPRTGATALALPTGQVAVAGGRSPGGQPVRTLELFIPPE
jgi:hypothetical protein